MDANNSFAGTHSGQAWVAQAPSNIALTKYMGKTDFGRNQALNSSLSYTLDYLQSEVAVTVSDGPNDTWIPWSQDSLVLTARGKEKFLQHWQRCRQAMAPQYEGNFVLTSRNHFASDCGLASSASSFAALTLAAYKTFAGLKVLAKDWSFNELASLSRQGSGSSCRSFFSPLVLWAGERVSQVETAYRDWHHLVVIVDAQAKKVSSSEAHKRVGSSLLYDGRLARAEIRTQALLAALQKQDWRQIYELTWADFWDMHVLFETSTPAFSYMLPESLQIIREIQTCWETSGDGPLITMDAGPNVHLLYRQDQKVLALKHQELFGQKFKFYSNLKDT